MKPSLFAIALFATLAIACAAHRPDPTLHTSVNDPLWPSADRVPLRIESSGREQPIAVAAPEAADPHPICMTPCTLYVPAGPMGIRAGGGAVRDSSIRVDVHRPMTRLRVRAPSQQAYVTARSIAAGGGALGLIGSIFSVAGPGELVNHSDLGAATLGVGVALLAVGLVLVVSSTTRLHALREGAESITTLVAPVALHPASHEDRF